MVNGRIVWSIAKRDFRRYFGDPTGYVFITVFILLSAAAAFWTPRFFADNLATLDQLNAVFPYLLVLFVAALTMSVWSDERKQGTDELLLTLPATDSEIVTGKFMAVVGVYTVAVIVSLSHAAVLSWLGHPDRGLMTANYLGFWTTGVALIAVGMVASATTANVTVAFVGAAILCAIIVGMDVAGGIFNVALAHRLAPFSAASHFEDFAVGILSVSALVYFVSVALFALYVNVMIV